MTKARRFRFPSERPGLDFLTTLGARGTVEKNEKLIKPSDLADWFAEAGLVETRPSAVSENDLEAARRLREVIHRLASTQLSTAALTDVGRRKDIETLNLFAAVAPPVPKLNPDGSSIERTALGSPTEMSAACLSGVARDAVEILGTPLAQRIKACANPVCRALYLDLSRPNNRKWCSMGDAGCGNRAKTNALRDRRRTTVIDESNPGIEE